MPLIIITLLNESRAHTKLQWDRYGGKNCKNLRQIFIDWRYDYYQWRIEGRGPGDPTPYFWTKLRPEGPDRAPHLSKGLDDRPHPLISRSGSGAVYNVFLLLFIFRDTSSLKENINR